MSNIHDTARAFVPYPSTPVGHAGTGPLTGLGFGVKDLFDVAGYPTGGGQPLLLAMSGIKTQTAPTVQKLLDGWRGLGFDARHGEKQGLPTPRGVARDIKQIFNAKAQAS